LTDNLQAVIDAAREADIETELLDQGQINNERLLTLPRPVNWQFDVIDLEQYQTAPNAKRGEVQLHTSESFVRYVNDHKAVDGSSRIYGDVDGKRVVAVLDEHVPNGDGGEPRWGKHTAVYAPRTTPEWTFWVAQDGKYLDQVSFAQHVQDGGLDIYSPDAASMLMHAQQFKAKKSVDFQQDVDLTNNTVTFHFEEKVRGQTSQTRAGRLEEFPTELVLSISPFRGAPKMELRANIRWDISDGHLRIGYKLVRPDRVYEAAFNAVLEEIALPAGDGSAAEGGSGTGIVPLLGTPPTKR
jgi:uncharacterized protein YfdQ (DUF2303 family)